MSSTPLALTLTDRVETVLHSIDGGAYSATVRGRAVSGTYNVDLSDAARVLRGTEDGWDWMDAPKVQMLVGAYPAPSPRNLCDFDGMLVLELFCFAASDTGEPRENQEAAWRMAHDVVVALSIDVTDGGAGTLKTLGVSKMETAVDQFFGQDEDANVENAGTLVRVVLTYPILGGAGL